MGWVGLFVAALGAQLLTLWVFPHVPSQDGPVHVSTADTLLHLADPAAPALREYFEARWRLDGSNFAAVALMGLLQGLPPSPAEKALVTAWMLLLPAAALWALAAIPTASRLALLLVLPFLGCRVLGLGFYSFVYGLVGFLVCVGAFLRLPATPRPPGVLALAVLLGATHLVHPFASAAALLAIGGMLVWRWLSDSASDGGRRPGVWVLIAALAPAVGIALFLWRNPPLWIWPSPGEKLGRLAGLSALVSHGGPDRWLAAATALLFAALTAVALRSREPSRDPRTRALGAAAALFFAALALTPLRIGEAGHLMERLAPYAYLLLMLWLAGRALPDRVWAAAAVAASVIAGLGAADRVLLQRDFGAAIQEYLSAAPHLDEGATVLALHFDDETAPPGIHGPRFRRVDPMLHAVATLATERGLVNLRSYQAIKGYFPLVFRPERNPIFRMSRGRGPAGILQHPFSASPSRYERRSGGRVDHVLVWDVPDGGPATDAGRATLAEVERDYELVFTSQPAKRMRVYRRRPRAP